MLSAATLLASAGHRPILPAGWTPFLHLVSVHPYLYRELRGSSVNMRVRTSEESRAKHDQTSRHSRPPFLGTPLVPSRIIVMVLLLVVIVIVVTVVIIVIVTVIVIVIKRIIIIVIMIIPDNSSRRRLLHVARRTAQGLDLYIYIYIYIINIKICIHIHRSEDVLTVRIYIYIYIYIYIDLLLQRLPPWKVL